MSKLLETIRGVLPFRRKVEDDTPATFEPLRTIAIVESLQAGGDGGVSRWSYLPRGNTGRAFVFLITAIALVLFVNWMNGDRNQRYASYLEATREMQVLAQGIALASQDAARGDETGFKRLSDAFKRFDCDLDMLLKGSGGMKSGCKAKRDVPASPPEVSEELNKVDDIWRRSFAPSKDRKNLDAVFADFFAQWDSHFPG